MMKPLLTFAVFTIFYGFILAQSPQSIPYQAVARDAAGNLIANHAVSLRFSIQDDALGTTVFFKETQTATTNKLGLFSVNVGGGTPVTGTFGGINWASGTKFLKVEMDPTGGNSYINMGTSQMMSVPYALYAASGGTGDNWGTQTVQTGSTLTGNGTGGSPVGLANTTVTAGSYTNTNITVDAQGRITAAGNGTNGTVTNVTGTAPIVSSGGSTPGISITSATPGAAGSMSAADKVKLDAITGTNTGDQTIILTSDVTGTGTGSFPTTIASGVVTNAKLANVATSTFKGRATAGTGSPEDLTVAQAKTLLNLTGTNSGDITVSGQNYLSLTGQALTANAVDLSGTNATGILAAARFPALTGDVTTASGSIATTLANSGVSAGTYKSVTVDTKGRVTGGTNPTTLAGYGITDAAPATGGTGYIQNTTSQQASSNFNISGNGVIAGNASIGGTVAAGAYAIMGTNISGGYYQDITNGAYRSMLSSATTNGYYFQTNNGGATTMYIGLGGTSNGNVGIGTITPSYTLQVQKTSAAAPALMIGGGFPGGPRIQTYGLDADANAWMGLGTDMAGGPYENSIYYSAVGTSKLTFGTYNGTTYTTKATLLNNGNFGIGAASPGAKLEVNGNVKITDGTQAAGRVLTSDATGLASWAPAMNVISTEFTNVFSCNCSAFTDVTGFTATITPSSTTSKILVIANVVAGMNGAVAGGYRIMRGVTPIAVPPTVSGYTSVSSASFYGGSADANNNEEASVTYLDAPGTTSAVTYKIQVYAPQGGGATIVVNGLGSDVINQTYSQRTRSSLTLIEVK